MDVFCHGRKHTQERSVESHIDKLTQASNTLMWPLYNTRNGYNKNYNNNSNNKNNNGNSGLHSGILRIVKSR